MCDAFFLSLFLLFIGGMYVITPSDYYHLHLHCIHTQNLNPKPTRFFYPLLNPNLKPYWTKNPKVHIQGHNDLKALHPLNPVSALHVTRRTGHGRPIGRASFLEIEKSIYIPVKQPKLSQVLLSFPWSTHAREPFRSARVCEEVLKFCPLAEKRGSLEGVRERGFKHK